MSNQFLLSPRWMARDAAILVKSLHRSRLLPVSVRVRNVDQGVEAEEKIPGGILSPLTIDVDGHAPTWSIEHFRDRVRPIVVTYLGRDYKHHIRARILSHQRIGFIGDPLSDF